MENKENKEIGRRLKQARGEADLTLKEVAQKVGVSDSTILRYEAGTIKKIKLPVVEAIAKALNVNPAWAILKSNDKNAPTSDDEGDLWELREELRRRPEMRVLFSATKKATKEDLLTAIKIIEALQKESEYEDM